MTLTSNS